MTGDEFDGQFSRLAAHFHLPSDETRETLAVDWLRSLQHYHVDALEHAVTELTRTSEDRYWPALGKVIGLIKARIGRYDRPAGKCGTCFGSTWVEAPAFQGNGLIYANVLSRCPDCGIPAPKVESHGRREPVSDLQLHEYHAGRFGRQQMPAGSEAKPSDQPVNPEMKATFEALRHRLFGVSEGVR